MEGFVHEEKMIVALLCSLVVSSLTGWGKTRVDGFILISLLECFDGSLGVSNNISTSYDATCSSLEELFANEEIDNSKYIAIK